MDKKKTGIVQTVLILFAIILIVALLLIGVALGMKDGGGGGNTTAAILDSYDEIPSFNTQLFELIESCFDTYYYTDIEEPALLAPKSRDTYIEYFGTELSGASEDEVTSALINCYIYAIGDIYSFYRTAEESEDYDEDMSGSFVGIGVNVLRDNLNSTITVTSVEPGSPAEAAGVLAGDLIVGVDGVRIEDVGPSALILLVRGEVGTEVRVTVKRDGSELTLTAVRAEITERTVSLSYENGGRVAYLKMTGFKSNTAAQFISAINEIEASDAEAIIFDLRGNPGGYLTAVCDMLSYLVPNGTPIVSFSGSKPPIAAYSGTELEKTDHVLTLPSAVICDGYSASAAELFTAAMRDYNDMELLRATVIGGVTYKKGIMQTTLPFTDGSTLTLTTALYNPPSGINFHGVGVTPDIITEEGEDPIERAISVLFPASMCLLPTLAA